MFPLSSNWSINRHRGLCANVDITFGRTSDDDRLRVLTCDTQHRAHGLEPALVTLPKCIVEHQRNATILRHHRRCCEAHE